VASPLSGVAVVEVDIRASVMLLDRIGRETTPVELVGVGDGDKLGERDSRLVGDEAGIMIELVGEAVERVEELVIVLEEDVDDDGKLVLSCIEDIGEGKGLELGGKVGTDGIEVGCKSELDSVGKNELDSVGKNELDRVSELEVWAELDTATVLDGAAGPDRGTKLGNAPKLENGVVLDSRTELDVDNGLMDNAEPDTRTELAGKAELKVGTALEYNAELDAAIKLEE
jgi:hypothetical protein